MCTINKDHMTNGSWDMKHDRQNILSFWTIFLSFYPTNNPKKSKFWKNKKQGLEILSFYISVPKIMIIYCFWDMVRDGCNFHFGYFLPFYFPNSPKNQIFLQNGKKKKPSWRLEIPSFYISITKFMTICYTVPEIWHMTDAIVIFHFGLFFALLPL